MSIHGKLLFLRFPFFVNASLSFFLLPSHPFLQDLARSKTLSAFVHLPIMSELLGLIIFILSKLDEIKLSVCLFSHFSPSLFFQYGLAISISYSCMSGGFLRLLRCHVCWQKKKKFSGAAWLLSHILIITAS